MPDEITRMTATSRMKEYTTQTLRRMIREDLDDAVKLGLMNRGEAFDEAIKAALNWKST